LRGGTANPFWQIFKVAIGNLGDAIFKWRAKFNIEEVILTF